MKIHMDFEIEMDLWITARRSDLVLINKKKLSLNGFCLCGCSQSDNKIKQEVWQILRSFQRAEKAV